MHDCEHLIDVCFRVCRKSAWAKACERKEEIERLSKAHQDKDLEIQKLRKAAKVCCKQSFVCF